jgi:two-component system, cell cycle response regulator CtrA
MRILLIEDDPVVAQSIELMLGTEPFQVDVTMFGQDGIERAKLGGYDLIVLDLNLPDISGYDVLRALRVADIQTPILILSGLGTIESKVKGLGFGADDYLSKPFLKDELVARIHAVLRRSAPQAEPLIQCGDLVIKQQLKRAEVAGQPVPLTTREFQLLELLALRQGSTLTKEMILNQMYGGMDEPELKIIDVYICKLRKKLAEASRGKNYIETVWGRGYTLQEPAAARIAS